MPQPARAGIDLTGARIRYAIVQEGRSGVRLLRLGECEFDFDVVEALSVFGMEDERDVLVDGLREALGSSPLAMARICVHPPVMQSFLSSAGAAESAEAAQREARMLGLWDEAASVLQVDSPDPAISLVSVYPRALRDAVSALCDELGADAFGVVPGLLAAGEVIRRLAEPGSVTLGVGRHGDALEALVLEAGRWRVGVAGTLPEANPVSGTIEVLCSRLGIDSVAAHHLRYGTMESRRPGEPESTAVEALDVVQHDRAGVDPDTEARLFAATIGAAIL